MYEFEKTLSLPPEKLAKNSAQIETDNVEIYINTKTKSIAKSLCENMKPLDLTIPSSILNLKKPQAAGLNLNFPNKSSGNDSSNRIRLTSDSNLKKEGNMPLLISTEISLKNDASQLSDLNSNIISSNTTSNELMSSNLSMLKSGLRLNLNTSYINPKNGSERTNKE